MMTHSDDHRTDATPRGGPTSDSGDFADASYRDEPFADMPPPAGDRHDTGPEPQTGDSRMLGLAAHLSAFAAFAGIPSFIGPLALWLLYRDKDDFVADQAREALNFNLSLLIYGAGAVLATILTIGIALIVIVPGIIVAAVGWLVLTVLAAVQAADGRAYRYPLTLRLVR